MHEISPLVEKTWRLMSRCCHYSNRTIGGQTLLSENKKTKKVPNTISR